MFGNFVGADAQVCVCVQVRAQISTLAQNSLTLGKEMPRSRNFSFELCVNVARFGSRLGCWEKQYQQDLVREDFGKILNNFGSV